MENETARIDSTRLDSQTSGAENVKTRMDHNVNKPNFGKVIDRFVIEVDSLASTFPFTWAITFATNIKAHKDAAELVEKSRKPSEDSTKIQLDMAHYYELQRLIRHKNRTAAAAESVPRSLLVALISQYDSFLGSLIQSALLSTPEILNGSKRSLTFAELMGFDSIEAARRHVLEGEIEAVLRESHAEQFEWLEKKFDVTLRSGLTVWPNFIEITERRNLFVHTGGQVSAQYLKVCALHKADLDTVEKGQWLGVTSEYFHRAYEIVFEIGVKLAHVIWRKLRPEEREIADGNLSVIGYNLLAEEKFTLAKSILDFAADTLKKYSSADYRLRFVINRTQAYKWSGDNTRAMQILDAEDFSALGDEFKLAAAVLRNDYKDALKFVKIIGNQGKISLSDYRDWPLFKEFRKKREFQDLIQAIFKEPLNQIDLEQEPDSSSLSVEHGDSKLPMPIQGISVEMPQMQIFPDDGRVVLKTLEIPIANEKSGKKTKSSRKNVNRKKRNAPQKSA